MLEKKSRISTSSRFTTNKKLGFIIPTLNEEGTIKETIDSVRRASSKLPIPTSILVIDANSTDRTLQICRNEKDVKVVTQKGKGKGNAMREAVEHTDADIVIFIDGDGTYSVANIEEMIEPLLNGDADMVIGD